MCVHYPATHVCVLSARLVSTSFSGVGAERCGKFVRTTSFSACLCVPCRIPTADLPAESSWDGLWASWGAVDGKRLGRLEVALSSLGIYYYEVVSPGSPCAGIGR